MSACLLFFAVVLLTELATGWTGARDWLFKTSAPAACCCGPGEVAKPGHACACPLPGEEAPPSSESGHGEGSSHQHGHYCAQECSGQDAQPLVVQVQFHELKSLMQLDVWPIQDLGFPWSQRAIPTWSDQVSPLPPVPPPQQKA